MSRPSFTQVIPTPAFCDLACAPDSHATLSGCEGTGDEGLLRFADHALPTPDARQGICHRQPNALMCRQRRLDRP